MIHWCKCFCNHTRQNIVLVTSCLYGNTIYYNIGLIFYFQYNYPTSFIKALYKRNNKQNKRMNRIKRWKRQQRWNGFFILEPSPKLAGFGPNLEVRNLPENLNLPLLLRIGLFQHTVVEACVRSRGARLYRNPAIMKFSPRKSWMPEFLFQRGHWRVIRARMDLKPRCLCSINWLPRPPETLFDSVSFL